ncbi:MAG: HYR domain-containing protein [Saprospiraceae bacterium]
MGPTATNLVAGANFVTVSDLNNCQQVQTITVTSNTTPPTVTAGPSRTINCNNSMVTLNASGSSSGPAFSYNWTTNNGNIVSGGTTLTPTVDAPGLYTLEVTNNSNGCTASAATTVAEDTNPPLADAGDDLEIGCGQSSIMLDGTGSDSGPDINYNWTSSNGNILSGGNTATPTVDMPGTYTLEVTNTANGCSATSSVDVTLNNSAVMANAGPDLVITCNNSIVTLDGSSSSSGPDIEYSWMTNDGNIVSGTNLVSIDINAGGTYVLTVIDNLNNCEDQDTVLVTENTVIPMVDAGMNDTLYCLQDTAILMGTTTPGINAEFSWSTSNGNIKSGQNEAIAVVDASGTYILVVTDLGNGCAASDTVEILEFNAPEITLDSIREILCNGDSDGYLSISISGGLAPFNILWSNGDTTTETSNLSAGTYTVEITDALGCADTMDFIINEPSAFSLNTTATGETSAGANDGTAMVAISGGTLPYSVNWSNGDTTLSINNLTPGSYFVSVTDGNNCMAADTIIVNSFDCNLTAAITTNNLACFGDTNGAANITISNGLAPFIIEWSNGDTGFMSENLGQGTYNVSVTDANNCFLSETFEITQPAALEINLIAQSNVTCNGGDDGSIMIQINGGTPNYQLNWSNGSPDSNRIENLEAGTYSVEVTDENGCIQNAMFIITQPGPISANFTITNESGPGANDGSVSTNPSGGTSPYQYNWSTGDTTSALSNLSPGIYILSITDFNNCLKVDSVSIQSFSCADFMVSVSASNLYNCPGSNEGQIEIIDISGGTMPYAINWSTGADTTFINNLGPGTYTLEVTDDVGCNYIESFTVVEEDTVPPNMVTRDLTVYLDGNGMASFLTAEIDGGTTDNCGVDSFLVNFTNFTCDDLGDNLVYAAVFDVNGLCDSDSATITVLDTISPVITCPQSIVTMDCRALDYGMPVATDNCGNGNIDITLSDGLPSGSVFPEGITTMVFDAVDASGNSSFCFFTVEVINDIRLDPVSQVYDCDSTIELSVGIVGGTAPYDFNWASGETGLTIPINGLDTIRITDSLGCTYERAFDIEVPDALMSSLDSTSNASNDDPNGAAFASVTGGTSPTFSNGLMPQEIRLEIRKI